MVQNSHLRGALHGGASLEEVDAMIAQVELVFGAEARIQVILPPSIEFQRFHAEGCD